MISSKFCEQCGRHTVHEKNDMSHAAHLIFTVLSGGLWLFVWIFLVLNHATIPWICRDCGLPKPGMLGIVWKQLKPWVCWYNVAVIVGAIALLGAILQLLGVEAPKH